MGSEGKRVCRVPKRDRSRSIFDQVKDTIPRSARSKGIGNGATITIGGTYGTLSDPQKRRANSKNCTAGDNETSIPGMVVAEQGARVQRVCPSTYDNEYGVYSRVMLVFTHR